MTNARFHDPDFLPISIMVPFAFGVAMFKPGFSQTFVDSSTDYPNFRKSLVKHGYTSVTSHEERHKDDVILPDAVVQESADGHECRCARANLTSRQSFKSYQKAKDRDELPVRPI